MKIKLFFLIFVFFFNNSFFVNGMEEVAIEDLKQGRKGAMQQKDVVEVNLPMERIKGEMTQSGVTSRSDGKFTPRNIDEIRTLAKVYSNKVANQRSPKRIRITKPPVTISNQDPIIIQDPVKKDDPIVEQEHISEEIDINQLAEFLADKTHIEPSVLADTILKLHGEDKKEPLIEETKGYEKMYEKNEDEYKDIVIELFKMILLNPEESSELSGESGKIVDTHVGLLRRAVDEHRTTIQLQNKTIAKKDFWLYVSRIAAAVQAAISTGLAIWAAYAQSQSCDCSNALNSTIT